MPSSFFVTLALAVAGLSVRPALAQGDESDLFVPDEDAVAEPPPVAPPPVAPSSAVPPPSSAQVGPPAPAASTDAPLPVITPRPPSSERVFGSYRVRLSIAKPSFDDGLKFYDKLYGSTRMFPTVQADWFAWDWYVTLGLSFRLGYYVADGYTAKNCDPTSGGAALQGAESGCIGNKELSKVTADDVSQDKNGPTTLTLIPMQMALIGQATPFAGKWVTFDGWVGVEHLYFQEVRTRATSTTSSGGTGTSTTTSQTTFAAATEKTDEDDGYTNSGEKDSMIFGVAANILLNPLDERSVASMRSGMGLGFVYVSPYLEFVRHVGAPKRAQFGRTVIGLGFTFESVR